ncbi:MAG: FecR domain-containing protein [Halofilum sp. (in: g-proteobacteria)]|nr:FecR domain-containing protein [Halofilum sp. (in: g-proteobacteria)]
MSRHGQPLDTRTPTLALLALLGLALALPATALAAEPVGRIIARSGGVSAIDEAGDRRRLDRRDRAHAGDTVRTRPRGQRPDPLRRLGMVDLEPRTRFGVEEYSQEEDSGSAVMNFLAGALRAVTGAIGEREDDEYRMNTPTATIGVRGTAYALRYCDATCAGETDGQPGLYGRVEDDFIVVDTPGRHDRGQGELFHVPEGGPPEGIVAPPDGILDGGDDGDGQDTGDLPDVGIRPGDEEDDERFPADPGQEVLGPDYRIAEDAQTVGPLMFAGKFAGGSSTASPCRGTFLESGGMRSAVPVTGADFPEQRLPLDQRHDAGSDITTVTNINETEALFDVAWGRWSGDPVVDGEERRRRAWRVRVRVHRSRGRCIQRVLAGKLNQFATYFNGYLGRSRAMGDISMWPIWISRLRL